jgi:hypothetical protein
MGWIKGKRPTKVAAETLPSTWALTSAHATFYVDFLSNISR